MRGNYTPRIFKNDILLEQDNKCAICGMPPIWNGKELVFIVDHIDGNAANNKRDNLRCICPNCDSQLDTYKFKNVSIFIHQNASNALEIRKDVEYLRKLNKKYSNEDREIRFIYEEEYFNRYVILLSC